MKSLILVLTLLAFAASAAITYADNSYFNNWKQWQAVQAQQQQLNRYMDRIDADAAKAFSRNSSEIRSSGNATAGPSGMTKPMYCLADCL